MTAREFREKAARALDDLREVNAREYRSEDERQRAMREALDRAAAALGADLGQQLADRLGAAPTDRRGDG